MQREKSFSMKGVGCCVLVAAALGGCDNGGGRSSSSASAKPAKLSGIVLNANGPVTNGAVEVADARGAVVANSTLSGSNKYSLTVPATAAYPVVLTAKPQGSGDAVKAVVTSSLAEKLDITTVSTLVVDNAMQLGGLSAENIAKASAGAINLRQSAGVSAGSGGTTGGAGSSGGGIGRGGHGGHDTRGDGESGDSSNNSGNISH